MQNVHHSSDNKRNVIGNITSLNQVIITVTRMNIQMLILLAAFHPLRKKVSRRAATIKLPGISVLLKDA